MILSAWLEPFLNELCRMIMKIRPLLWLCSLALISLKSHSAEPANDNTADPRWFEVEIVLFRQLDDKSQLQEQFPEASALPKPKLSIDLLSAYLQPNISSLKQLLGTCGVPLDKRNLWQQSQDDYIQQHPLFSTKSIEQLASEATLPSELTSSPTSVEQQTISANAVLSPTASAPAPSLIENTQTPSQTVDNINSDANPDEKLTAQQQTILTQIAQLVQAPPLLDVSNMPSKQICQLSAQQIQQLHTLIPNFNADSFPISQVPTVIDAPDYDTSNADDSAYLLSASKFQLNDIVSQLKRSRNFRPLLHMGWRLVPQSRINAIPLHIYAGNNLTWHYQQQLANYQQQLQQAQQQADNLASNDPLPTPPPSDKTQQSIQQIIDVLTSQRLSEQQMLTELSTMDNHFAKSSTTTSSDSTANTFGLIPPKAPLQPWYVDGYLTIHLNHYLYINADFSIMNKTLAEQATDKLEPTSQAATNAKNQSSTTAINGLNTIHFTQDRRVISQEIHYFDHPYLGMIIQIRRYSEPDPEPAAEQNLDPASDNQTSAGAK